MNDFAIRMFLLFSSALLVTSGVAAGQTAVDVSAAFVGTTISPGVEICYEGDTGTRLYTNDGSTSEMKTEVSPNGDEKFKFGDGFLSFNVKTWKSFYAGTKFRISKVKLNKHNVEMILVPTSEDDHVGDLELDMPDNYATQPVPALIAHIKEMLKLNTLSATAPKKGTSTGKVSLDCVYKERMLDPRPVEVIFDEGEKTASLQNVGKPLPMRPANFTDALIKWNNGASEQSRAYYTLSRSTGELTELFGDGSNAVNLTCSVRAKKF